MSDRQGDEMPRFPPVGIPPVPASAPPGSAATGTLPETSAAEPTEPTEPAEPAEPAEPDADRVEPDADRVELGAAGARKRRTPAERPVRMTGVVVRRPRNALGPFVPEANP